MTTTTFERNPTPPISGPRWDRHSSGPPAGSSEHFEREELSDECSNPHFRDDSLRWQQSVRRLYDADAHRSRTAGARYYHRRIQKRLAAMIEPGARVLDIGCGDGQLLAALRPAIGVGIDFHAGMIERARKRFPSLRFIHMRGEDVHALHDTFDYVMICQALGDVYDLRTLFQSIRSVCHSRTRLIIVHYNRMWQPLIRLMERLGVKPSVPEHNWLPSDEVVHLLHLGGFETVRSFGMNLLPLPIPPLSAIVNRYAANLPLLHLLGLNYVVVARPVHRELIERSAPKSVSIIVPARNEAGHITSLLRRIPRLLPAQEVIFVEGNSTDDTWNVILQAVSDYDGPFRVRCLQQTDHGKGDAVRAGFAAATGELLVILDADLSVPPEELPAFVEPILSGKGEFINGSRMVYLMDRRAMRFLNLLGNKFFGWMFTYLLSQRFRDTLCGTKLLLRSDYERIARNRREFGDFDPFGDFDLLFGAARLNLKIVDVPVHYKARIYGETNISRFRHGAMLLRMCLFAARRIRFL